MDNVNKTLYIPLYGKAFVSKKKIILHDPKAEEIWFSNKFKLKGKSKSKWLAYYMGMRSSVFDNWLKVKMNELADAVIIHIGCGLDSRIERVGSMKHLWYDIDFPQVIQERRRYYDETDEYRMVGADVRNDEWLISLPNKKSAIIIMEGVSMYLRLNELRQLLVNLSKHFECINVLLDCYTVFAAKASKYKNPINDVGVTSVYGLDDPKVLEENSSLYFVKEHEMTPVEMINELKGLEKVIFKKVFAGKISKKMYRLYEFQTLN